MYFLSVISVVRNEELTIAEWIRHHIWQGVDHFFLIDNGSSDKTIEILKEFGDRVSFEVRPGQLRQVEFLSYCFSKNRHLSRWFSICDPDEFWYGPKEKMVEVVKRRDGVYSSIFTNWKHFGSMGFSRQPDSVRLQLVRCGDIETSEFDGKCIFMARDAFSVNVHSVATGGRHLRDNIRLRLNHYRIQSDDRFERKRAIGLDWVDKPLVEKNLPFNWFVDGWDHYRSNYDQNKNIDTSLRDLVLSGYGHPLELDGGGASAKLVG